YDIIGKPKLAKNEITPRVIPISALKSDQRGWTMKARVTKKQKLRHFKNARGEGKDFSFNLLNSIIEAGKVYLISEGSLKLAQKEYSDHQILLASTKIVQQCSEDDDMIPRQQFLYHK
ncbi:hypothetical protein Gorai_020813, partial [Gossypium raimondii]|nr:hypothetical protein [Gossypium raimondii]